MDRKGLIKGGDMNSFTIREERVARHLKDKYQHQGMDLFRCDSKQYVHWNPTEQEIQLYGHFDADDLASFAIWMKLHG